MIQKELYEIFDNLRYHHENEVVEFKKAENNFDFDGLEKYFIVFQAGQCMTNRNIFINNDYQIFQEI